MSELLNIIYTVLSVIIGGLITMSIGRKEIQANTKINIYLDFIVLIDGRYNFEITNDYLRSLRKVMLVANDDVIKVLKNHDFIPEDGKMFLKITDTGSTVLGDILRVMRKDIGFHSRYLKKFDSKVYYTK